MNRLFVISSLQERREIENALHNEHMMMLEQRKAWLVGGCVVGLNLLQFYFLGLAMHLTGDGAQAAKAVAVFLSPASCLLVVLWQLKRRISD